MEEGLKSEPEMSVEEATRIGEEGARRLQAAAKREAERSWRAVIKSTGELEGSSGETMTITLDPVLTQRMKAASSQFGKSVEDLLLPFLHMMTVGAICYPVGEWQRTPDMPVVTVAELERLKEMV